MPEEAHEMVDIFSHPPLPTTPEARQPPGNASPEDGENFFPLGRIDRKRKWAGKWGRRQCHCGPMGLKRMFPQLSCCTAPPSVVL